MKFALVGYGTRGDIEPCVAVGRELLHRGHEVRMGVPPDLIGFVESAGLVAVAYGLDTKALVDAYRNWWTSFFGNFWKIGNLIKSGRELWEPVAQCWAEMSTALTSLAEWTDLLVASGVWLEPGANAAEHCDIPLATLHTFPKRPNGHLVPILPSPLIRSTMAVLEWLSWRLNKRHEDAQRRELDLPKATSPLLGRIAERGSLEIQAYDEVCFPGLATEWAQWGDLRPFVGTLTMELTTGADDEVASWVAAGTPPICFAFGSIPVGSPADTVAMISAACGQLGERALVCAGGSDFNVPHFDHVKVVGAMNYATIFPVCRAVVHHGGAGTTAASLRAGVPMLILWTGPDQSVRGARVKRLKVGAARRFSTTTPESLVADLRRILAPQYVAGAREIATQMTKAAVSVTAASDLLETFARLRHFG